MKGRRRLLTSVFLLTTLLSAGCWDHQPPEDTAFILMIGLDKNPEKPDEKTITQLAVLPSGLPSGEESGRPEGSPFYLLSNTGHTLEGAQLSVVDHLSRLPRLDHMEALVLSQEVAREGKAVEPAVAWALRHPQIRPGTFLFVAEQTAQQFLDATPALDPLPGAALVRLMNQSERVHHVFPVRVYEFAQTLLSPYRDGAIPIVRRVNPLAVRVPSDFVQQPYVGFTQPEGGGSGEGASDAMETQIKLVGMAVFKGQRMVGSIMHEEGQGLVWIRDNSKVSLAIQHPAHSENFIAAITIRSHPRRGVRLDGEGRVVLTIDIETFMDVWGEGKLQPLGIGPDVPGIERDLAETIQKQVHKTMAELQKLEADIFGFAGDLYRQSPDEWGKVKDRWDELYRTAEVHVQVDVTVRRTGLSR